MDVLMEAGTASVEDLSLRFGVSKMTVHRDLDDLEQAGLLRKVHGGASIQSSPQFESDFRYREKIATVEKRRIAEYAAGLVEPGQSHFLPAIFGKVGRIEPALEIGLALWPFGIQHGEPRGIPISPFDDHVLAENSFKPETEAQCGPPRRRIEGIALPFVAAVSQVLEDMARHEIHGLGSECGLLQSRSKENAAYFDHAMDGLNAHVGSVSQGVSGG